MRNPNDDATTGLTVTRPFTDALRAAADFLDAHPGLVPTRAFIPVEATAREHLEALAAALGDRAVEQMAYGNESVEIEGRFGALDDYGYGGVRVYAQVPLSNLTDKPVITPTYRPIITPTDESADERFDRLTGEGRR